MLVNLLSPSVKIGLTCSASESAVKGTGSPEQWSSTVGPFPFVTDMLVTHVQLPSPGLDLDLFWPWAIKDIVKVSSRFIDIINFFNFFPNFLDNFVKLVSSVGLFFEIV